MSEFINYMILQKKLNKPLPSLRLYVESRCTDERQNIYESSLSERRTYIE